MCRGKRERERGEWGLVWNVIGGKLEGRVSFFIIFVCLYDTWAH